jgi:hypothetical protein
MLKETVRSFIQDIEALPEDALSSSPGGAARSPSAIIAECAGFARMVRANLLGETHERPGEEAEAAAMAGMTKEAALSMVRDASDALLETWNGLPSEDLSKMVPGFGEDLPAYVMVGYVSQHFAYHDGQLNYVQAMRGDDKMHWSD